jgi:hypothetical protein
MTHTSLYFENNLGHFLLHIEEPIGGEEVGGGVGGMQEPTHRRTFTPFGC